MAGSLNSKPFDATVSTGPLTQLLRTHTPLPVRVTIETADAQFKAEGAFARPFADNEFEIALELAGKEIEGLAPLLDFAVPLQGEFSAKGRITARGKRFEYEGDLRIGKSDLKTILTLAQAPPCTQITGRIVAQEIHLDDIELVEVQADAEQEKDRSRVIPDNTIPVNLLTAADLDLDVNAGRIMTSIGALGDLVSKVKLKDGRFKSSLNITGFTGEQIRSEFDINAAAKPPQVRVQLNTKDLDVSFLQQKMLDTGLVEGRLDLYVDLSGVGATQHSVLENADGRVTVISGPGRISGRRLDLWAADLIPTMLSP